ncbi:amino acid adenylation domain-containing protein [Fibrobacterota bacterium]
MYTYNLGIRFNSVAAKYPGNTALKFSSSDCISYEEINKLSNRLARFLLDKKISRGDVVCISGSKKASTFAGMLACLKTGAVYAILDPDSPAERLRKIMAACGPKVLLCGPQMEQKLRKALGGLEIITNEQRELKGKISGYEETIPEQAHAVTGSDPAYIMFTSGSTGFPKGAVMSHANVLNLIDWSHDTYGITPDDVLTNVNPVYFDNSVFDFYSALFSGAALASFTKDTVTDAKTLVDMIDELKCTQWFSVPTLLIFLQTMKVLNSENLLHIKRIIFGGEGYPKAKLKKLFDLYSGRIDFFNVYGPTECTCICSSYKLSSEDFKDLSGFPPLGEMIKNFSYLILDTKNRKVKDNETGELCLLGPNVGMGYYNDPERTGSAFVQNPYNQSHAEVMYKTGDMVRYNPKDGKVYIGGRKDNQIKHMGYRIELEEIETALSCLDYISQSAVLHGSSRGLSRIISVVSAKKEINEETIRGDLKRIIPEYMVPSEFHIIDELPRNPNGKVDRKRLADEYLNQ